MGQPRRRPLVLPLPVVSGLNGTLSPLRGLHQGVHVVIADEQPPLLDFMVCTLRGADYCVFQAYDGLAALELPLALKEVELLITDTGMPGLNGSELIRQVRAKLPALPILHVQNAGADRRPDGLPPDVSTLREPFTADELLAAVERLLSD